MKKKAYMASLLAALLGGGRLARAGGKTVQAPTGSILSGKPVLIQDMMSMPMTMPRTAAAIPAAENVPALAPSALPDSAVIPEGWLQPSAAFDEEARAAEEGSASPAARAAESEPRRAEALIQRTQQLVMELEAPAAGLDAATALRGAYDNMAKDESSLTVPVAALLDVEKFHSAIKNITAERGKGAPGDVIYLLNFLKTGRGRQELGPAIESLALRERLDRWIREPNPLSQDYMAKLVDAYDAGIAAARQAYSLLEKLLPRAILEERARAAEKVRRERELEERLASLQKGLAEREAALLAASSAREIRRAIAGMAAYARANYIVPDGFPLSLGAGLPRQLNVSQQANIIIRREATKRWVLFKNNDAIWLAESWLPKIEMPESGGLSLTNEQKGQVSIAAEAGKVSLSPESRK